MRIEINANIDTTRNDDARLSLPRTRHGLCRPTDLLQDGIDLVPILELEHLGRLVVGHALAVEEEAEGGLGDALALGVGLEDLAHLGGLLDLELSLLAVLGGQGGGEEANKVGVRFGLFIKITSTCRKLPPCWPKILNRIPTASN